MTIKDNIKNLADAYVRGTASEEDLEYLSAALKKDEEALGEFRETLSRLESDARTDDYVRAAFDEIVPRLNEGQKRSGSRRPLKLVVAASLAAAASAALFFMMRPSSSALSGEEPVIFANLETEDHTTLVTLPDSTRVLLSPGARLITDAGFSAVNRKVNLDGEAFFEVKSDAAHPFVISAGECTVKVLGTVFGLNSCDSALKLTLLEGKVNFTAPRVERTMTPGESMTYEKESGSLNIVHVDTDLYRAWVDGNLEYYNLTFGELVERIGALYGKTILIDSKLSQIRNRYSIRLSNHETEEDVLDILNVIVPINVETRGDTVTLVKKN